jgi:hypothetical protein
MAQPNDEHQHQEEEIGNWQSEIGKIKHLEIGN